MANKYMTAYLNDHLAGALTALELISQLEKREVETDRARFLAELHTEVAADRAELKIIMAQLNVGESGMRQTAAWIAEKAAELKLRVDDPEAGEFYWLEGLETLSLGIAGKHGLWRALEVVAGSTAELQNVDFGRLKSRAEDQRAKVEVFRQHAARAALKN